MIGFDERDGGKWRREHLHKLTELDGSNAADFHVGDAIQFRIVHDRYGVDLNGKRFKLVDGEHDHLWCKGKIVSMDGDFFTIQHTAWNALMPNATTMTVVTKDLIRGCYSVEADYVY